MEGSTVEKCLISKAFHSSHLVIPRGPVIFAVFVKISDYCELRQFIIYHFSSLTPVLTPGNIRRVNHHHQHSQEDL